MDKQQATEALLRLCGDVHDQTPETVEKARILIEQHGANIYAIDVPTGPLWRASNVGHTGMVALLLEKGADIHADHDDALARTAVNGHMDTMELLLAKGADIHAHQDKALRYAANNGHKDMVALLIEKGADVHASDNEALRSAAAKGFTGIVAMLEKAAQGIMPSDEARREKAEKDDRQMRAALKKRSKFQPRPDNLDRAR